MLHGIFSNATSHFLVIRNGRKPESPVHTQVLVPLWLLPYFAIPLYNHAIVCDNTGLQTNQRVNDLKSRRRQKSTVAIASQVINGELSVTVIEQSKTAVGFLFIKIFFQ